MDPEACFQLILKSNVEDGIEHLENLLQWLERGGPPPKQKKLDCSGWISKTDEDFLYKDLVKEVNVYLED